MDISLNYVNPKIARLVPMQERGNPARHMISFKLKNAISCRSSSASDRLEITEDEKKANFYEVLSLSSKNVGLQDIRKAYRSMALLYHPDVCPDPSAKEESTRRFVELQKAYETLSNPVSRRLYDYELSLAHDNLGFGADGRRSSSSPSPSPSSSMFSREVWENQLRGLKRRSQIRMRRRKY
ncbi:Terminal organelle assembly protein [Parasponia andersonii]|uniref:Terminal organelle assembly protein n=1 Tax=Parasponia andersonii TaxID=3476 RepID=A0A2P5CW88_PARAD|nr:Terminal organelle assembly protein [Parasponia andersonii]